VFGAFAPICCFFFFGFFFLWVWARRVMADVVGGKVVVYLLLVLPLAARLIGYGDGIRVDFVAEHKHEHTQFFPPKQGGRVGGQFPGKQLDEELAVIGRLVVIELIGDPGLFGGQGEGREEMDGREVVGRVVEIF
jgi:hypothetical protein